MTDPAQRWRAAAVAAASLLPFSAARAEPSMADLLQRLEEQEQKILVLERKLEIKEETDKSVALRPPSPRRARVASASSRPTARTRSSCAASCTSTAATWPMTIPTT